MELSLAMRVWGDYVVVGVDGEVDIATSDQLGSYLSAARQCEKRGTIVDLSQVAFMDCSGLRALTSAQRDAVMHGGELRLAAPQPSVAKVLALSGVYRLMPPFPTVEIAAEAPSSVTIVTDTIVS